MHITDDSAVTHTGSTSGASTARAAALSTSSVAMLPKTRWSPTSTGLSRCSSHFQLTSGSSLLESRRRLQRLTASANFKPSPGPTLDRKLYGTAGTERSMKRGMPTIPVDQLKAAHLSRSPRQVPPAHRESAPVPEAMPDRRMKLILSIHLVTGPVSNGCPKELPPPRLLRQPRPLPVLLQAPSTSASSSPLAQSTVA